MDVFNYLDTESALSDNVGPERENFSNFVKESQKVTQYLFIFIYKYLIHVCNFLYFSY